MRRFLTAALLAATPAAFADDIETLDFSYALPNGEEATSVVFFPEEAEGEEVPVIFVIPEWWGLNDYAKMRAEDLAHEGYVAIALDMYGGDRVTEDPGQAGQWAGAAQQVGLGVLAGAGIDAAEAALDELAIEPDGMGAIGFCFGGSTVVALAQSDWADRLDGVVSFHGGLSKDSAPQGDYAGPPMLILHGGADPLVPPDAFGGFVQQAVTAGVPLSIVNFPDAVHAFTNPGADAKAEEYPQLAGAIAFDEEASEVSFEVMFEFFEITIGEPDDD